LVRIIRAGVMRVAFVVDMLDTVADLEFCRHFLLPNSRQLVSLTSTLYLFAAALIRFHGIVMSGWRPLIKSYFAVTRRGCGLVFGLSMLVLMPHWP
jgi:hypothetical protein